MNTQTQEALKMAIEWMDKWHDKEVIVMDVGTQWVDFSMAIQACKEALESQEQDSLRWANAVIDAYKDGYEAHRVESQKPLSGKFVAKLIKENMCEGVLQPYSFVNAIEKAHGIGGGDE